MPTQTEYLGTQVTNIGPATTVFTPAASCSTAAFVTGLFHSEGSSVIPVGNVDCETSWKLAGCIPNGDKLDEMESKASKSPGNAYLPYMSPGLVCPSGWTTAGGMVGDGASGTSRAGVFTHTELLTYHDLASPSSTSLGVAVPGIEQFARLLDKGETVIACCPKGYDANYLGFCQSIIGPASAHSVSRMCERIIPSGDIAFRTSVDGTTYNPPVEVVTNAASAEGTIWTRTIHTAAVTAYDIGKEANMLIMIHQASDVKSQAGDSPSGTSASGTEAASGSATGTSGASKAASGASGNSASASPTSGSVRQARIPIALGAVAGLFMLNFVML